MDNSSFSVNLSDKAKPHEEAIQYFSNFGQTNFSPAQMRKYISDYESQSREYQRCQVNQYIINFLLNILEDPTPKSISSHYPLFRSLKCLILKFMINEFEIIFLVYFLNKTSWNYRSCESYTENFEPFLFNSSCYPDEKGLVTIQLYLSFCAYTVKLFCNKEVNMFRAYINDQNPNFLYFYDEWCKSPTYALLKNISPIEVNTIFQKYRFLHNSNRNMNNQPSDYNCLVDEILRMAPSTNGFKEKIKKKELLLKSSKSIKKNSRISKIRESKANKPLSRNSTLGNEKNYLKSHSYLSASYNKKNPVIEMDKSGGSNLGANVLLTESIEFPKFPEPSFDLGAFSFIQNESKSNESSE